MPKSKSKETVLLNGRSLKEYKVSELKEACKERSLPHSGNKSTLVKRLVAAIQLEALQKEARENQTHSAQPNIEIAEKSDDNDFIKQYMENQRKMLEKQQPRSSASESEEDSTSVHSSGTSIGQSPLATRGGRQRIISQDTNLSESETKEDEKTSADDQKTVSITSVESMNKNEVDKSENHESKTEVKSAKPDESFDNGVPEEVAAEVPSVQEDAVKETPADQDTEETKKEEKREDEEMESEEQQIVQKKESTPPPEVEPEKVETEEKDIPVEEGETKQEEEENMEASEDVQEEKTMKEEKTEEEVTEEKPLEEKMKEETLEEEVTEEKAIADEKEEEEAAPAEESVPGEKVEEVSQDKEPEEDVAHKDEEESGGRDESHQDIVHEEEELDYEDETMEQEKQESQDSEPTETDTSKMEESVATAADISQTPDGLDMSIGTYSPIVGAKEEDKTPKQDKKPLRRRLKRASLDTSKSETTPEPSKLETNEEETEQGEIVAEKSTKSEKVSEVEAPAKKSKRRIVIKKPSKVQASEGEDSQPKSRKRRWGSIKTDKSDDNVAITSETLKDIVDFKTVQDEMEKPVDEVELMTSDPPQPEEQEMEVTNGQEQQESQEEEKDEGATNEVEEEEEGEIIEEEMEAEPVEDIPQPLKHDGRKVVSRDREDDENVAKDAPREAPKRKIVKKSTDGNQSSTSPPAKKSAPEAVLSSTEAVKRDVAPSNRPESHIVHVKNLVRPFTLKSLKQLLMKTGSFTDEQFWIDKIKSHCVVAYTTAEEAASTRNNLHQTKWPLSNPKELVVDFITEKEMNEIKGGGVTQKEAPPKVREQRMEVERQKSHDEKKREERGRERNEKERGESERDKSRRRHGDERRSTEGRQRRERSPKLREWDRDKLNQDQEAKEKEAKQSRAKERDRSPVERESRRARKEKEKVPEEPPAKLLDDLFKKTKAIPSVYWLPLTDELIVLRDKQAEQRRLERKLLREKEEEERAKRREEREQERKARENERKSSPPRRIRRDDSEGRPIQRSRPVREPPKKPSSSSKDSSSSGSGSSSSDSSSDDNSDSSSSDSSSEDESPVKKTKK